MKNPFTSIREVIEFALCSTPIQPGIQGLLSHFESALRDHATDNFSEAMSKAQDEGKTEVVDALASVYESLYGPPAPRPSVSAAWVIYYNPTDKPGKTIARLHDFVGGPTQRTMEGSLEDLRKHFSNLNYTNLGRHENDEPQILETWIK